jgi:hypothetical protein
VSQVVKMKVPWMAAANVAMEMAPAEMAAMAAPMTGKGGRSGCRCEDGSR